jgi:hypothetical protein
MTRTTCLAALCDAGRVPHAGPSRGVDESELLGFGVFAGVGH